jgi:hypothetical protein
MEQFGFSMIEAEKMVGLHMIAPSNLGISKGTCPANKHHSWKFSCQAVIKFYYPSAVQPLLLTRGKGTFLLAVS